MTWQILSRLLRGWICAQPVAFLGLHIHLPFHFHVVTEAHMFTSPCTGVRRGARTCSGMAHPRTTDCTRFRCSP